MQRFPLQRRLAQSPSQQPRLALPPGWEQAPAPAERHSLSIDELAQRMAPRRPPGEISAAQYVPTTLEQTYLYDPLFDGPPLSASGTTSPDEPVPPPHPSQYAAFLDLTREVPPEVRPRLEPADELFFAARSLVNGLTAWTRGEPEGQPTSIDQVQSDLTRLYRDIRPDADDPLFFTLMALQMHQLQLLSVMHAALHSIVVAPTSARRATAEAQLLQLAQHRDALAQSFSQFRPAVLGD